MTITATALATVSTMLILRWRNHRQALQLQTACANLNADIVNKALQKAKIRYNEGVQLHVLTPGSSMNAFATAFPPQLKPQATVQELKSRLDWGEPALTIIDVRDRADFNKTRIQGSVSMPLVALTAAVDGSLEKERDIYIYGDSDAVTAEAANQLRMAGYQRVAELKDGLPGWKAAKYPVEGL